MSRRNRYVIDFFESLLTRIKVGTILKYKDTSLTISSFTNDDDIPNLRAVKAVASQSTGPTVNEVPIAKGSVSPVSISPPAGYTLKKFLPTIKTATAGVELPGWSVVKIDTTNVKIIVDNNDGTNKQADDMVIAFF